MEHVDIVYTTGIDESEVGEDLREGNHGVLALANDDDAYAVPLNYHYDGERFLIRVANTTTPRRAGASRPLTPRRSSVSKRPQSPPGAS